VVDASLTVLSALDHPVERRGAYAAYVGSGEYPVRVRVLRQPAIGPGETGLIRFWFAAGTTLPLLPGDRYVLREAGRSETVGGGEVLDVAPVRPASRAAPTRSVERVVAERGWVAADELERLTGVPTRPTLGRWVVDPPVLDRARRALTDAVARAAPDGVDLAALDERQRAVLAAGVEGLAVRSGRMVDASAADGGGLPQVAVDVLVALEASPWSPPDQPPAARPALRELARRGLAVEAGEVWFAASAVASAAATVAGLLGDHPDGVTVAEVRDALGTSRKHVLPLLVHLDATGVTRRRGDVRVAGPRLPAREAS